MPATKPRHAACHEGFLASSTSLSTLVLQVRQQGAGQMSRPQPAGQLCSTRACVAGPAADMRAEESRSLLDCGSTCAGGCSVAGSGQGRDHRHRLGQGRGLHPEDCGGAAGGHHVLQAGLGSLVGGSPARQQARLGQLQPQCFAHCLVTAGWLAGCVSEQRSAGVPAQCRQGSTSLSA